MDFSIKILLGLFIVAILSFFIAMIIHAFKHKRIIWAIFIIIIPIISEMTVPRTVGTPVRPNCAVLPIGPMPLK